MNFEPLGDRVVIRPDEKVYAEKSPGGVDLIPGDEKEAQSGVIMATGDGIDQESKVYEAWMLGKRVVYSPWTGFAITIDGETFKILSEGEIMGILTDAEAQVEVA